MIYSDKLKLRKNRQMHHLKSKPCSIADRILHPKKILKSIYAVQNRSAMPLDDFPYKYLFTRKI